MAMPPSNTAALLEEIDGEHLEQDVVVLDMPLFSNGNKFSINVPSEPTVTRQSRPISSSASSDRPALSSSDSGGDSSDDESGQEAETRDTFDANHSPPISRIRPALPVQQHPRFSRAFSLPLPSQLNHLQNPRRRAVPSSFIKSHSDPTSPELPQFKELSFELADSVQMVIQTMLQVSPAQVLDPAKEQFAACSLAVPTPSMSAMFTALKNLNYISANMSAFAAEELPEDTSLFDNQKHNDFDIGELLQSTGDAFAGLAAQAGVDLVLFHGDVALKHIWIKGDEFSISYLLSHLIRQILPTCQRGDTLELGLFVNRPSSSQRQNSFSSETSEDSFRATALQLEGEGPLECVVEIFHKFSPASTSGGVSRPRPAFSTLFFRRLLSYVGATLSEPATSSDGSLEIGRKRRLVFTLNAGSSPLETPATVTEDNNAASEPTLDQLSTFVDSLRGKKVHLYASSKGSFAHHLTSYLTAWGMDVSHISAEGGLESIPDPPSSPTTTSTLSSANIEGYTPSGIPPKMEPPRQPKAQPVSFIFIDDDVTVLKDRLQAIRDDQIYPLHLSSRRPSLSAHHRPRSSPQIARAQAPPVLLHFTSLANYKVSKDSVQSVLSSYRGTLTPLPEIMIIPKPAGPRRFLTQLYTAVTKPVLDPFFFPIATTPSSPYNHGGFFSTHSQQSSSSPRTPSVHRPSGSRTNSDRSSRSINNILENHPLPPSPLSIQESNEYFSDSVAKFGEAAASVKLGDTARAGVILQSPDGQPTGIFFSPRAEKTSAFSSYSMERDRGHLSVVSGQRRSITSTGSPSISFSSLHEAAGDSSHPPGGMDVNVQIPTRQNSRGSVSPRTETVEATSLTIGKDPVARKGLPTSPPASPLIAGPSFSSPRNLRRPRLDGKGLSPTPSSKKSKSPAENNIVPPISVLIVDDNPINRTILLTFMKKKQIKYDVASNGKEAVEKWKTGEFHLILMDIQMPVMDGIDATRMIRHIERVNAGYIQPSPSVESVQSDDTESRGSTAASPYRSSVIIVALTASSLQSDRIAALAAGCNDFLTKPVSLQWLNNKLIEWGSIKALSMYAEMTPDVVKTQNDQAKNIAERLHVPHVPRGRKTPPSPPAPKTAAMQPATPLLSATSAAHASPRSSTSSSVWTPQPSANISFRAHLGLKSPDERVDRLRSQSPSDEPAPTLLGPTVTDAIISSPVQSQGSNGLIKSQLNSDLNASTPTLTQREIFRLKSLDEGSFPSPENVRENGSTSSVSRTPSPTTPVTPDSPPVPTTNKSGDVEDPTLNLPGGCVEVYAQGGETPGDPLVVTP